VLGIFVHDNIFVLTQLDGDGWNIFEDSVTFAKPKRMDLKRRKLGVGERAISWVGL
jgi:hypothetical protein